MKIALSTLIGLWVITLTATNAHAQAVVDVSSGTQVRIRVGSCAAQVLGVAQDAPMPVTPPMVVCLYYAPEGADPGDEAMMQVGACGSLTVAGRFNLGSRALPSSTAPGQPAWVQIRVHEAAFGASYAEAIAAGPGDIDGIRRTALTGKSPRFLIVTGTPQMPAPIVAFLITFYVDCQIEPEITLQPENQVVPLLGQAIFRVEPICNTGLNYEWRKNGQPVGLNQPTLTINSVQAVDAGAYSVVLTNLCGSVTSQVAHLVIQPVIKYWSLGNGLSVEIMAAPGRALTLQSSTNLKTWTNLGPVVLDDTGNTIITQTVSPTVLQRFYRLSDP